VVHFIFVEKAIFTAEARRREERPLFMAEQRLFII
jgi:hypothetical protein